MTHVDEQQLSTFLGADFNTPPAELFHYCGADGARGILADRKLRATSIQHLADWLEAEQFRTVARQQVAARTSSRDGLASLGVQGEHIEWIIHQLHGLKTLLRAVEEPGHLNTSAFRGPDSLTYVTSFSTDGDSLSQWRAFTPASGGFCIGFDTTRFRLPAGAIWVRCMYEEAQQRSLVERALDWVGTIASESGGLLNTYAAARVTFAVLGAACKHKSFLTESEWRVVFLGLPDARSFTTGLRGGLVPFNDYSFEKDDTTSVVSSLRVGPGPHQLLAQHGLRQLGTSRKPYILHKPERAASSFLSY